jgi:hypothetical protein
MPALLKQSSANAYDASFPYGKLIANAYDASFAKAKL